MAKQSPSSGDASPRAFRSSLCSSWSEPKKRLPRVVSYPGAQRSTASSGSSGISAPALSQSRIIPQISVRLLKYIWAVVCITSTVELVNRLSVMPMFHNVHYARAQSITIDHNCIRLLLVDLLYYFVRELNQVQAAMLAQNA